MKSTFVLWAWHAPEVLLRIQMKTKNIYFKTIKLRLYPNIHFIFSFLFNGKCFVFIFFFCDIFTCVFVIGLAWSLVTINTRIVFFDSDNFQLQNNYKTYHDVVVFNNFTCFSSCILYSYLLLSAQFYSSSNFGNLVPFLFFTQNKYIFKIHTKNN